MALYAIGDIQGCLDQLKHLLERIQFDPPTDHLWFTGDLVNRGPKSVETLRFVKGLGEHASVVLGNHDLHLLAAAAGFSEPRGRDTLDDVLDAPDRDELLHWLVRQPLLHHDPELDLVMVHAGLHPHWDIHDAVAYAREVETVLESSPDTLYATMYGDRPRRWRESLEGADRLRFITNVFTRMRYVDAADRLSMKFKGAPSDAPAGLVPWFKSPKRHAWTARIVFGHWSSLDVLDEGPVISLDSGCVWGRCLTAIRLNPGPRTLFSVDCAELADES